MRKIWHFQGGMNQEASQDTDLGLLDATLMQNLQDRFCDANNVYLVCLEQNARSCHKGIRF